MKGKTKMGFLTHVDDIKRKNELIYDLIFGNASIVTIAASGTSNDLSPLQKVYMESSRYSDRFSITEHVTNNPDGNYSASLTFIKK